MKDMHNILDYCRSPYTFGRRRTREVTVGIGPNGPVTVGGDNPIRVQSMTTTDTRDTEATVDQVVRLVNADCEIVRITAPKVKDARNLGVIRNELTARGVQVPLVADIHFLPSAAMEAAEYVDKVRVNPGNFADRKVFAMREYSDTEYGDELERIDATFRPLVLRCKELGRAMRIGTNHGSLSDRIMSRFGDTPDGMVESALEFVRICEAYGYHDIILSMKASNAGVMIAANRLLVARMDAAGMDYPIHLGVTEAGDGEDGRIKSAIGIGSLLEDGIGDTIRVSLTEEPECEVPVCIDLLGLRSERPVNSDTTKESHARAYDPYAFTRRAAARVLLGGNGTGASEPIRVATHIEFEREPLETLARDVETLVAQPRFDGDPDPKSADGHDGAEIISVAVSCDADLERLRALQVSLPEHRFTWAARMATDPVLAQKSVGLVDIIDVSIDGDDELTDTTIEALLATSESSGLIMQWRFKLRSTSADPQDYVALAEQVRRLAEKSPANRSVIAIEGRDIISAVRFLADRGAAGALPLLLSVRHDGPGAAMLHCSVQLGSLLCDGLGDIVEVHDGRGRRSSLQLAYNLLQAAGRRITKTEFISCPSCGRTLFDLQTTTERIKSKTGHLKDVRIAIMGCIVNGPGEMADADFGYVGAGTKRVSLYVGKECVERDIPEDEADDRLIQLIKSHDRWVAPISTGALLNA
jgi:(E)-4-hydroxy-3-methylbut-2-enyl-diphosphate synthase